MFWLNVLRLWNGSKQQEELSFHNESLNIFTISKISQDGDKMPKNME